MIFCVATLIAALGLVKASYKRFNYDELTGLYTIEKFKSEAKRILSGSKTS
ncbi:MAG: hypothetical protein IJ727_03900 [Treponema sp.]|nr:hypothetical protein [Treponema sp.]